MNEAEALEALKAIGLRGEVNSTGSADWRRIFMIDASGVTQGRLSFFQGKLYSEKFYVSKVANGPRVLPDERLPCAWRLWTTRGELLTLRDWSLALGKARHAAHDERDEKQAWRDANPKRGKRPRLELNVRKYLYREIFGAPEAP